MNSLRFREINKHRLLFNPYGPVPFFINFTFLFRTIYFLLSIITVSFEGLLHLTQ